MKKNYASDPTLLTYGFWYGQDYTNALKKLNTEESLKKYAELKESGDLILGRLPPSLFKALGGMDGRRSFDWQLLRGIKPSDALKHASEGFKGIKDGLALLDCGATVTLARYIGLMNYLQEVNGEAGIEKFNRLFSLPHGNLMNIGYIDTPEQPMRYFIAFTEAAKQQVKGKINHRPIKVGQVLALKGVEKHSIKHPYSLANHFNLICVDEREGNQRFTGLGFSKEGASEEQVYLSMINEYNETPDHFSRINSRNLKEAQIAVQMKNQTS